MPSGALLRWSLAVTAVVLLAVVQLTVHQESRDVGSAAQSYAAVVAAASREDSLLLLHSTEAATLLVRSLPVEEELTQLPTSPSSWLGWVPSIVEPVSRWFAAKDKPSSVMEESEAEAVTSSAQPIADVPIVEEPRKNEEQSSSSPTRASQPAKSVTEMKAASTSPRTLSAATKHSCRDQEVAAVIATKRWEDLKEVSEKQTAACNAEKAAYRATEAELRTQLTTLQSTMTHAMSSTLNCTADRDQLNQMLQHCRDACIAEQQKMLTEQLGKERAAWKLSADSAYEAHAAQCEVRLDAANERCLRALEQHEMNAPSTVPLQLRALLIGAILSGLAVFALRSQQPHHHHASSSPSPPPPSVSSPSTGSRHAQTDPPLIDSPLPLMMPTNTTDEMEVSASSIDTALPPAMGRHSDLAVENALLALHRYVMEQEAEGVAERLQCAHRTLQEHLRTLSAVGKRDEQGAGGKRNNNNKNNINLWLLNDDVANDVARPRTAADTDTTTRSLLLVEPTQPRSSPLPQSNVSPPGGMVPADKQFVDWLAGGCLRLYDCLVKAQELHFYEIARESWILSHDRWANKAEQKRLQERHEREVGRLTEQHNLAQQKWKAQLRESQTAASKEEAEAAKHHQAQLERLQEQQHYWEKKCEQATTDREQLAREHADTRAALAAVEMELRNAQSEVSLAEADVARTRQQRFDTLAQLETARQQIQNELDRRGAMHSVLTQVEVPEVLHRAVSPIAFPEEVRERGNPKESHNDEDEVGSDEVSSIHSDEEAKLAPPQTTLASSAKRTMPPPTPMRRGAKELEQEQEEEVPITTTTTSNNNPNNGGSPERLWDLESRGESILRELLIQENKQRHMAELELRLLRMNQARRAGAEGGSSLLDSTEGGGSLFNGSSFTHEDRNLFDNYGGGVSRSIPASRRVATTSPPRYLALQRPPDPDLFRADAVEDDSSRPAESSALRARSPAADANGHRPAVARPLLKRL